MDTHNYELSPDDVAAVVASIGNHPQLVYDDGTLRVPASMVEATAAAIANIDELRRVQLKSYASAVRYNHEVAGITIDDVRYLTDRETQSKLTSAVIMAQINSAQTFHWKAADGFVELTATEMIAVAQAVGAYVQACFAIEGIVTGSIEAGTITTTEQVDGANWPPNS